MTRKNAADTCLPLLVHKSFYSLLARALTGHATCSSLILRTTFVVAVLATSAGLDEVRTARGIHLLQQIPSQLKE